MPTVAGVGLNGNSPEIAKGIETAVRDGMDVINLSLGEPEIDPGRDLVVQAINGAAAAGVVPVVAAGNDYAEFGGGSVTSPGSAADAITVAAVTAGAPPAARGVLLRGPDARLAPAEARRQRSGRGDPLVRAGPRGHLAASVGRAWPHRTSRAAPLSCSSATRPGRRRR